MKQKSVTFILLLLAVLLSVVGCAATENPNMMNMAATPQESPMDFKESAVEEEIYYDEQLDSVERSAPLGGGDEEDNTESYEPQSKKIVYHSYLNLETTDYDKTNTDIVALVNEYNGYIEHSSVDGTSIDQGQNQRYSSYTVRIPDDQANAFLSKVKADFHVNQTSNSATDITKSYYDTDSKLKSLQDRVTRLEAYIEQAEALEDMLTIEREISSTKADIDMYYNMMEAMKNDIAYQTVDISIREVLKVSASSQGNTFGQRMKAAFINSWSNFISGIQNIIIGITHNLPAVIIVVALCILVFIKLRKRWPLSFLQKKDKSSKKED